MPQAILDRLQHNVQSDLLLGILYLNPNQIYRSEDLYGLIKEASKEFPELSNLLSPTFLDYQLLENLSKSQIFVASDTHTTVLESRLSLFHIRGLTFKTGRGNEILTKNGKTYVETELKRKYGQDLGKIRRISTSIWGKQVRYHIKQP